MSQYVQPGIMDRYNNAHQHNGPTMLFDHAIPGSGGKTAKVAVSLDSNYGVRTNIQGLPEVSRSSPRSFEFNPHDPPRHVDARHQYESPGGLPFSTDHNNAIERATATRKFGTGSIGGAAATSLMGSPAARSDSLARTSMSTTSGHEAAASLQFHPDQTRAKTPPYARGRGQRIGQNRYNVTEDKPMVGQHSTRQIDQHIDSSRMNTKLAPKIPLNTVSEQAFQTSTNEARVEGNQMRAFMRAPRPDMMYYSQDTIDGSREQMLQTFKKNEIAYNAPKNSNKKQLLSSHLVKDVIEDHHPVQDMLYQHHNNSTIPRTITGGKPKWNVSEPVDAQSKGWNGQRGQNISNLKQGLASKPPMQSPRMGPQYPKDTRVRGKITAVADTTYRPNAGNMNLDRDGTNGVAGRTGQRNHWQDQQNYEARKARMLAGSGNPITGALPVNYQVPTFRDIELLNHQQYG